MTWTETALGTARETRAAAAEARGDSSSSSSASRTAASPRTRSTIASARGARGSGSRASTARSTAWASSASSSGSTSATASRATSRPMRAATTITTSSATTAGRSSRSRTDARVGDRAVADGRGYVVAAHDVVLRGACEDCAPRVPGMGERPTRLESPHDRRAHRREPYARRGRAGGRVRASPSRSRTRRSTGCARPRGRRAHGGRRHARVRRDHRRRHAARRDRGRGLTRAHSTARRSGAISSVSAAPTADDVVRASLLRLANTSSPGSRVCVQRSRRHSSTALNDGVGAHRAFARDASARQTWRRTPTSPTERCQGARARSRRGAGAPRTVTPSRRAGRARGRRSRSLLDWIDVAARTRLRGVPGERRRTAPRGRRSARPYAGIGETLDRMHELLDGSALWEPDAARFLQDPLTFRCVPQVHGAAVMPCVSSSNSSRSN